MRDLLAYPRVAARLFDVPLLVARGKLNVILGALAERMNFDVPQFALGESEPEAMADALAETRHATPDAHEQALLSDAALKNVPVKRTDAGYLLAGDVAVIPIVGSLVQRSDWMSESSGMMGYGRIASRFAAALDDPAVREILLEIDSPGGEVAGAFDLADGIYAARGQKPITAVASELAASAAYLIASAADEIVVPRTGYVGSVGVVAAHYDYSKQLEKRGVAVTLLYAGEKKVDGNPFGALDARVRDEWMAEIKSVYQLFVNTVARNLGIAPGRVASTEAGTFMGSKAVDVGFATRVNTFANELGNAMLRTSTGGTTRSLSTRGTETMMTEAEKAAAAEAAAKARAEGLAEGQSSAATQAAQQADAERARVKEILGSPEAEGREELARHLAFETKTSAADAVATLKAAPKAEKKGPLAAAMDKAKPSGVKGDQTETTEVPERKKIDGQAIFKRRREQVAHAKRNGIPG